MGCRRKVQGRCLCSSAASSPDTMQGNTHRLEWVRAVGFVLSWHVAKATALNRLSDLDPG